MTDAGEHEGYVLDPESPVEMARLINLDRFMTKGMGGSLVGVENLSPLHNILFLFSVLTQEQWPGFIAECTRLLRPGGMLRLTELIDGGATNSPAKEQLHGFFCQALQRVKHGFSVNGRSIGMTIMLPRFLREAGYQQVQHKMHALEVSAGTEVYSDFYRNSEIIYLLAKPLFVNTGVTTDDEFDQTYQQMLIELRSDNFTGMWHYMTALGVKPLS